MAKKHSDHLWRRGGQWYFRMVVPRPLHSRIVSDNGKHIHMITKALGDSESQARRKRDRLVVICNELFDRAKAGETITADQVKAAMSLDLGVIAERIRADMLDSFHRATPRDVVLHYGLAVARSGLKDPPDLFVTIAELAKREGVKIEPGTALWDSVATTITRARNAAYGEAILLASGSPGASLPMMTAAPAAPVEPITAVPNVPTETISEALEAWLANPCLGGKPQRPQTTEGHRTHVNRFIKWIERERHVASGEGGDIALSSITRAVASDYIASLKGKMVTRTKNQHRMSLKMLFDNAGLRGRLPDGYKNPFDGLHQRLTDEESESSYSPFEASEIKAILDSFAFETSPKHHTNQTALPWACLIATFSGMCLEEIAQLSAADIHDESANGSTVTVIDIHNGGKNHLKNYKGRVRKVPIHSELVRVGLLRYRDALPKGSLLFPGLTRRASKGGKIGARTGELFGKNLKRLGIKQKAAEDGRRLSFHSYRHSVVTMLERAGLHETVIGAIVGHAGKTITSRVYGKEAYKGAGLKVLAGYVEQISYPGLKIPAAKVAKGR